MHILPRWFSGKKSACQCRKCRFDPWIRKIPWRRKWQPTPVFLPGKFHGQKNLVGYSPWGCRELDTTEHTHKERRKTVWTQMQVCMCVCVCVYVCVGGQIFLLDSFSSYCDEWQTVHKKFLGNIIYFSAFGQGNDQIFDEKIL